MYPTKEIFEQELQEIRAQGTYKQEKTITGLQGTEVEIDGKKILNFCANNYLGLAGGALLRDVAKEGLDRYGFGMASVRFIAGTSSVHMELEKEVSKFLGTEDTILYSSCFDANTGLFETILKEGDAIFSDELNHASLIDGIRLCKAERFRYKHSDMVELEQQLKSAKTHRRKLIATDGVFSMDGDMAKLQQICALAKQYDALVVVDESHATGVLGPRGRGTIEALNVGDKVDLITSTFGKALGGAGGGFTSGRKEIIALLRQRSRTTLFSNSLTPAVAYAALHVLKNFDTALIPLKNELTKNTAYFREHVVTLGYTLSGDGSHPITPVMLYDEHVAVEMADRLFKEGIYVRGFTYPVVPKGKARIRMQLSSAHTKEQLNQTIMALSKVGKDMKLI